MNDPQQTPPAASGPSAASAAGFLLLAGDIGGTKTFLALHGPVCAGREGPLLFEARYPSRGAGFTALLDRFLADARRALGVAPRIGAACIGVAGPVIDGRVKATNLPWLLDEAELAQRYAIPRLRLVNDFAAVAAGLSRLSAADRVVLQEGEPLPAAPRVVIGAGTGLGVAAVVPEDERERVLAGEGGHMGFAPADAGQMELWRHLARVHGRVSVERVVSGPGLAAVYRYVAESRAGGRAPLLQAADPSAAVAAAALAGDDELALGALDLFVSAYGAFAGDLALLYAPRGGVYLAGGVAPKILPHLRRGGFCRAFADKGRHAALMASYPIYVVTDERLGLRGAAASAAAL